MQKVEHYLNDVQAANYLNLAKQTLRNWRLLSKGPAYSRAGRAIRYSVDDLRAFMDQNRVSN
jgi:hypothetical protein